MPPVGFEPTISAGERPQTYALDCAATGTGNNNNNNNNNNNKGSRGMGEVAPLYGVDSALVLTNPGVQ